MEEYGDPDEMHPIRVESGATEGEGGEDAAIKTTHGHTFWCATCHVSLCGEQQMQAHLNGTI